MRREDVDAFADWARHTDPLFGHYNLPPMGPADAERVWSYLAGTPDVRRAFAGVIEERVIATLIVRKTDPEGVEGEIGIMLDPAFVGRGLGRRILNAFAEVLAGEGFRRLHLEVAGFNRRAIAAYLASGFTAQDEYWSEPEPGLDVGSLLDGPAAETVAANVRLQPDGRYYVRTVRMERRLSPSTKDDPST